LLDTLDCIWCEVFGGIDTATIDQIAEIKINRKRLKELGQYYDLSRTALANLLGIVPNPFDQRNWWYPMGINVTVNH
jgi:hypothetical protein